MTSAYFNFQLTRITIIELKNRTEPREKND